MGLKATAIKGYNASENLLQAVYDAVPDKLQIATHGGGVIAGTLASALAAQEAGKKGLDWLKDMPDQFVKNYNQGNYTTAFLESAGRTMGAVVAGGVTLLIVGVSAANIDAAVRSFFDKAPRG
jgi:hypothetical protein